MIIFLLFSVLVGSWGGRTGNTSKQQRMSASSEDFVSEDNFDAVLATLCCYNYGAKSSEAVVKIATN